MDGLLYVKSMEALDFSDQLQWTAEAKAKLKNIPYFVRSQARQRITEIFKIHFSEPLN
jgi:hypothetical protein